MNDNQELIQSAEALESATEQSTNDHSKPRPEPVDPYAEIAVSDEERISEFDQAFPSAKAEEFRMPQFIPDGAELTPELIEFDRNFRDVLAAAKFTRGGGSAFAEYCFEAVKQVGHLDEMGRKVFEQDQMARVKEVWGPETEKRLALAKQLLEEIDERQPGTAAWLASVGATSHANVVIQLGEQAMKLLYRQHGQEL